MQQPPQFPPPPQQGGWNQPPYGQQPYGQQPYGYGGGPPPPRPGSVTAASVLLIVLAAIPIILAILAFIGASFISGDKDLNESGFAGLADSVAKVAVVFGVVALGYGVVKLIAGIQVLKPKNGWRVTGIVFASIGAAFWVLALIGSINGNQDNVQNHGSDAGGVIFSAVLLAMNVLVIVMLGRAGSYFHGPAYRALPPQQQYQQQGPFST